MFISKERYSRLVERVERLECHARSVDSIDLRHIRQEVVKEQREFHGMGLFGPGISVPTLRGKVEAICEFLGIDFDVTEPVKSQVKATKVTKKKKGRK